MNGKTTSTKILVLDFNKIASIQQECDAVYTIAHNGQMNPLSLVKGVVDMRKAAAVSNESAKLFESIYGYKNPLIH